MISRIVPCTIKRLWRIWLRKTVRALWTLFPSAPSNLQVGGFDPCLKVPVLIVDCNVLQQRQDRRDYQTENASRKKDWGNNHRGGSSVVRRTRGIELDVEIRCAGLLVQPTNGWGVNWWGDWNQQMLIRGAIFRVDKCSIRRNPYAIVHDHERQNNSKQTKVDGMF